MGKSKHKAKCTEKGRQHKRVMDLFFFTSSCLIRTCLSSITTATISLQKSNLHFVAYLDVAGQTKHPTAGCIQTLFVQERAPGDIVIGQGEIVSNEKRGDLGWL